MRTTLAVVGGLLIAMIVIMAVESVGMSLYPLPPGVDVNDPASLAAGMSQVPDQAFLMVGLAWLLGTSAGAAFAAWQSPVRSRRTAMTVGIGMQAAGVADILSFPHPAWMYVVATLVFLPPSWVIGTWFAKRRGQL